MSFEPVDVLVETAESDPVEGVLVKVYDPTGTVLYTQDVTDDEGMAAFLLETLEYTLRFYKFHTTFSQPQHFTVLAEPEVNLFVAQAELFERPIATDPRLCRCSGFFRDVDGSPKQWLDMAIIAEFDPVLLDDAAVVTDELHLRTDESGHAQVDLIRGANYYVTLEAMGATNMRRLCRVPDAASCNLPDLLFPRIDLITFDPEGPFDVAVGAELEITPTVYDSVGRPLEGTANQDVQWSVEDDTVAGLTIGSETLTLRGVAAGSTQLQAVRLDNTVIKIPDTPIQGVPVDITVT